VISHLALVSDTPNLDTRGVLQVAAAVGKQVVRDFAPIWSTPATVDAFAALEDVPTGYWPIIVMDDIGYPGAQGIHLDDDGKPFGLVNLGEGWSLTASHEVLELLGDPLGNTLRAGPSIKEDQGRVEYLVEVCDPSEAWEYGYDVNGIRVSDFYTPEFFLPFPSSNVRYSYTGAIEAPRQILKGGYLSWLDPATGHWWQQAWFSGNKPEFRDLGTLSGQGSPREQIDRLSAPERLAHPPLKPKKKAREAQAALVGSYRKTASGKASRLRKKVEAICDKARADAQK
jgi:hypothetical protein